MSPVNQLKSAENRIVNRFGKTLRRILGRAGHAVGGFFRKGRQRITVMLIPHAENEPVNFQISFFSLFFIFIFLTIILGGAIAFAAGLTGTSRRLTERERELIRSEATLENLREEVNEVVKSATVFQKALDNTIEVLGLESGNSGGGNVASGDISSFTNLEEVSADALHEVSELHGLQRYLDEAVYPLEEIGGILDGQKELLADIPTMWPIKGVRGYITNPFGPAEDPWPGQLYLHSGLDIAYYRLGIPLVAAANGKVVEVESQAYGYGNYVVIKHKYGFYTLYGHMHQISVKNGQNVRRGEVIGIMGSTGNSTGRHVHFEVRIGSQFVDPLKYLSISSAIVD